MEGQKPRFTDFFDLLEVDHNSSKDDVQKAFMLKASIWHPDKADSDDDREYYTKIYQDLQTAYKILSNEHSRKQYIDARQTTDMEFKSIDRNVGYACTNQFKANDGKFDADAFQTAFTQSLDQKELDAVQNLKAGQFGQTGVVDDSDYQSLMERRVVDLAHFEAQTDKVFTATDFDANTFNRAFDFMKEKNPGKGVQLYDGNPMAMFSGGGLEECDPMSGINFGSGTNFTGQHMDNLVMGQSINPGAELDLKAFHTGEQYGQEQKLTNNEIQQKMAAISADREDLAVMNKEQFVVEPSEIELLYSDLFQPMNVEGLEAPINIAGSESKSESEPELKLELDLNLKTVTLPLDSSKIRKKIEQKKRVTKIQKNVVAIGST
jgi:curved DNA-binding protein CbpA